MAAGLGGILALSANNAVPIVQKDIIWQSNYATAQAAARQSGKPLFVVFR